MKRYSEMTREELLTEIDKLREEERKAEFPSQVELLERKLWMAKSYMLSTDSFTPGTYGVVGQTEPFELEYVNGVMAWGRMGPDEEACFPLSMLKRLDGLEQEV